MWADFLSHFQDEQENGAVTETEPSAHQLSAQKYVQEPNMAQPVMHEEVKAQAVDYPAYYAEPVTFVEQ